MMRLHGKEDAEMISNQFPDFNLGDKVVSGEEILLDQCLSFPNRPCRSIKGGRVKGEINSCMGQ